MLSARLIHVFAGVAVALGALAVGAPPVDAAATVTHVDCGAPPGGTPDGSVDNPYTTLAQVNSLAFDAGDHLLFKRGSACTGMLAPRGSGTAANPWIIGDYGTEPIRARIDGAGADNAVLLRNVEGVVIRDLELTNQASPGVPRRGLHVLLHDFGEGQHYVVENLYVHDVVGHSQLGTMASDGILFSVTGTAVPTNFDDVRVEGNAVVASYYGGIRVGPSDWNDRPENGDATIFDPWTPHTDVRVLGNLIVDVGGDGIVVHNTAGALVEGNHVVGFHLRDSRFYAGIWTINSNDTVIQFNDVTGGRTTDDGMAYDSDIGSVRTLIQYNYSANNEGGFALLCPGGVARNATVRDAVIRYNVSQNDETRGVHLCQGRIERAHVYNNTMYIGAGRSMGIVEDRDGAAYDILFENNVVVKEGDGAAWVRIPQGSGVRLDTNAMANVLGDPRGHIDPRLVARGTATSLSTIDGYRLHTTSPALGAASPITGNGGRDIFGNPVAASGPTNIGAYEGVGVAGSPPAPLQPAGANHAMNGGFETGSLAPHWAASNGSVSGLAHSGSFAGQVSSTSSGGSLQQTVSGLAPGGTYLLSGWAVSDGDRTTLGAKNFGDAEVFRPVTAASWRHEAVTFTVGDASSSAVVYCYRPRPGTGRCDDVTLVQIR